MIFSTVGSTVGVVITLEVVLLIEGVGVAAAFDDDCAADAELAAAASVAFVKLNPSG